MASCESDWQGSGSPKRADEETGCHEWFDDRDPYSILLDEFYPGQECDHGPIINAASAEDSTELQHILHRSELLSSEDRRSLVLDCVHDMGLDGTWNTPLLEAIIMRREASLRLLLEAGSNPNGISLEMQKRYSAHLRVIRDWRITTNEAISPQNDIRPNPIREGEYTNIMSQPTLSAQELAVRAQSSSKFWTVPNAAPLDSAGRGDMLHSLVAAAAYGSVDTFERLCEAGADTSFWVTRPLRGCLPDPPTPSSLCVSTPLHAAVRQKDINMLSHLLDRGFDPNVQPSTAMCQGLTPVQSALVQGKEPNLAAFHVIAAHPSTDFSIQSPIYKVHLNHLAAARLEPELLETVSAYIALQSTPPTALGHTVLHIACLPLTDLHIQFFAPTVYQSIHDVRTLDPRWEPVTLNSLQPSDSRSMPDQDWPPLPTVIGPTMDETGILDDTFLGLPREERTRYAVHGEAGYMTPHPSGKGPMIHQTYGRRGAVDYEPIHIADEHERQTVVVKRLVNLLGGQSVEKRDVYGNTALHYLAAARDINAGLIAWLRHFEIGGSVWDKSCTRWGWTPRQLWLDGSVAIEEDGKSFWREEGCNGVTDLFRSGYGIC